MRSLRARTRRTSPTRHLVKVKNKKNNLLDLERLSRRIALDSLHPLQPRLATEPRGATAESMGIASIRVSVRGVPSRFQVAQDPYRRTNSERNVVVHILRPLLTILASLVIRVSSTSHMHRHTRCSWCRASCTRTTSLNLRNRTACGERLFLQQEPANERSDGPSCTPKDRYRHQHTWDTR